MTFKTADLYDNNQNQVQVVKLQFQHFGKHRQFSGQVTTLKVFEDFGLIKQTLTETGDGHILVIDGGGSINCAMFGDKLASLAIKNQWGGILINGCIRDSADINTMDIGVKCLGTCPAKPAFESTGERQVPVSIGDTMFTPGDYLYADEDGALVSRSSLL